MAIETLSDKPVIERHLRADAGRHLYELGDLDDFFWPRTKWYGLSKGGALAALALVYSGNGSPVLLALDGPESSAELLSGLSARLPGEFYCHLAPGLEGALQPGFELTPHGRHLKMLLADPDRLLAADAAGAVRLGPGDLEEVLDFYGRSYPGNWFDPRMLETGRYFGIREGGGLASVAGVHVFSEKYRVAALGNIATDPSLRGRGLGRRVTAALCRDLTSSVGTIGLNVKADNAAAIACYQGLGFAPHAEYGEWAARRAAGVRPIHNG